MLKTMTAVMIMCTALAAHADEHSPATNDTTGASAGTPTTGEPMSAMDRVKVAPKGQLKNPYSDDNPEVVAQGKKLYLGLSCNGCHGGGGGGGMCPPLSNDTWVYGGDDDTLFRLVTLGSVDLQKEGYTRIGHENVIGPMPPHGSLVKSDDDLWKIITFIRANYRGSPAKKFGNQPTAPAP